jgi:hypothetical protein
LASTGSLAYDLTMTLLRLAQVLVVAAALGLFVRGPAHDWADGAAGQSSSTIGLLAIDADPRGNTATFVGPIDGCARAESGSTFDIDYVVEAIPQDRPMTGFDAEIRYDQALLEVVKVDYQLLLAAVGTYSPLASLTDSIPDFDGKFRVSVLDTASSTEPKANVESGPGVLARVTFRAKASGVSKIAIGLETEPFLYPLVLDTQDEMILADRLGAASVAIGVDCPPEAAQPHITDLGPTNQEILAANPQLRPSPGATGDTLPQLPTGTGSPETSQSPVRTATPTVPGSASSSGNADDDSDTWLIAGLAALVALGIAAAGGGWYLYQRSRRTSAGN